MARRYEHDATYSWQKRAKCRDARTVDFFPGPHDYQAIVDAKAVCAVCEVRKECGEFADSFDAPPPGVWGGRSEHARKRDRRTRREVS